MEANCQNCGESNVGNFCMSCGQDQNIKRIDRNYAFNELLGLFGFEKGFIYTCKELFLRPGKAITGYLYQNRQKLVKPITFLGLASLIYTLVAHFLKTDVILKEASKNLYSNMTILKIMDWTQSNYGYANLLMILPIAFFIKLLFKDKKVNFYEAFVIVCYVMGTGMLIYILEALLTYFFPKLFLLNSSLVFLVSLFYMSWAIGQVFGKQSLNYIKAFFAYWIGFAATCIFVAIIALFYDFVIK
jgi:hypothetical protein